MARAASKRTKRARSASGGGLLARVGAFLRDERVHKVSGLFLILASFYLLVAFTSYLFTWRMDQDMMSRTWGEIFQPHVRVENWLGKLGAILSHRFIFIWFGVAAFIFVLWAFLAGVRITLRTWLLPAGKTLRWSLMGLLWLPTLLGFLFAQGGWQVLGGGIGLERELARKPAGLRTNLLICVGAALLHVGQVRLVRLDPRWGRRGVLVLTGGQAAPRAVPDLGDLHLVALREARGRLVAVPAPVADEDPGRGLPPLALTHRARAHPASAYRVGTRHPASLPGLLRAHPWWRGMP